MKIEISRGCTAFYNEIDGKNMYEYSGEALQTILLTICSKIEDHQRLIDAICILTEELGEFESDNEPCEQCGDTVYRYILEI